MMRKTILRLTAIVISTATAFVACMDSTAEKNNPKKMNRAIMLQPMPQE